MSKLRLAVPVCSFLFVLFAFQAFSQTSSANPPQQPAAAAADDKTKPLPDEELARLYIVRKQYKEAQDIFRKLTVEHPKSALYWNELGITYHNQGDLGAARKCYEKSSKLDKRYADPQNNIGTVWYERKKYPKAIRAYKRAIAVREDSAPFYLNLGYAYFAQKLYPESIDAFRKALQYDPQAFDPAKNRAGTVIQDRSISEDKARFFFLLAKSFAEAGDVERCVLYLKRARDEGYQDMNGVNSDPSFAKVVKEPAIQEILTGKPPEATTQQ